MRVSRQNTSGGNGQNNEGYRNTSDKGAGINGCVKEVGDEGEDTEITRRQQRHSRNGQLESI